MIAPVSGPDLTDVFMQGTGVLMLRGFILHHRVRTCTPGSCALSHRERYTFTLPDPLHKFQVYPMPL
jgi:hypothetical protein